jgi:hypothetical protein
MKVIALVQDAQSIARYLGHLGLPTEEATMAPARGPPFPLRSPFSGGEGLICPERGLSREPSRLPMRPGGHAVVRL